MKTVHIVCDFCKEEQKCSSITIDSKKYDICQSCRASMDAKLKGAGEDEFSSLKQLLEEYRKQKPYIPVPYPYPYPVYPSYPRWNEPYYGQPHTWGQITVGGGSFQAGNNMMLSSGARGEIQQ